MKIVLIKDPSLLKLLDELTGPEYTIIVSNSGKAAIETYDI